MRFIQICLISLISIGCIACQTEAAPDINLKEAAEINAALGVQYTRQKAFQAAEEKLQLATLQDKNSVHVQLAWAYFYQQTQQFPLAKDTYLKALALSPKDPEIWNNYGAFLCAEGEYIEALRWLSLAADKGNYRQREQALSNKIMCQKALGT